MADDTRWSDARQDYITSSLSYRQIAEKYGIPFSTVCHRGRDYSWSEARTKYRQKADKKKQDISANAEAERYRKMIKCADTLTDAIFKAIMAAQASEEGLSARDSKSYASALKDLKDVQSIRSADDAREQAARIAKLEKEVAGDEKGADGAVIEIEGLPEAWRE